MTGQNGAHPHDHPEQELPLPNGTTPEDLGLVAHTLLRAVRVMAENAAGEDRAAEAKDYASAAKSFADALVVLDPTRLQGGDTPEARRQSLPEPPARTDRDRDGKIGE